MADFMKPLEPMKYWDTEAERLRRSPVPMSEDSAFQMVHAIIQTLRDEHGEDNQFAEWLSESMGKQADAEYKRRNR